jgi:glucose/arabinose dehydrogenase
MKVICISRGERGAEFVNPQDITRDNGKIYRPCGWKNSCRQSFCRKTGAKEAIYSYGHRNPQGLAKPNYRRYLGSRARTKGGDEINIIKRCCYVWLAVVTYGIDYDGTTISDKTKTR